MPKEGAFRKGTKSCVECRQRKLRCIPSEDESRPCQNCTVKGRQCVLQVTAGRRSDAQAATSRDRIRHLEDSVGKLWSIVKNLQSEVGKNGLDSAQGDRSTPFDWQPGDDGGSETDSSDLSAMNRPTHLQQLFDNEILDTQGATHLSPEGSIDKNMNATVTRARSKLQALIPPRSDFLSLAPLTLTWFGLYNRIFASFSLFKDIDEIKAKYDGILLPDADPVVVAALLLWMAIAVQNSPSALLQNCSEPIKDGPRFVRRISDAVEEAIVTDDDIASSISGIEISLLWTRLQLIRTNTKRLWLMLRRCIALAELIGLPRNKQEDAAAVWESICVMDRIIGMMFNLPLGTAAHGLPPRQEVVAADGQIIVSNLSALGVASGGQENNTGVKIEMGLTMTYQIKAYLNNLARISVAVQSIDEDTLFGKSDAELFDKVSSAHQDLLTLRSATPDHWWTQEFSAGIPDLLMQYWHHYLTVRMHLQLALRDSTAPECLYSFTICMEACQNAAERYVQLRTALPPTFFAGRIIDLEAMTVAVFLIYSAHRPAKRSNPRSSDNDSESPRQLAFKVVHMMDAVCAQVQDHTVVCDVARRAGKAIRQLDKLLNQPASTDSQSLSLTIPMLGRLNVSRHAVAVESSEQNGFNADLSHQQYANFNPDQLPQNLSAGQPDAFSSAGIESIDPFGFSMDLMMDPGGFPMADEFFEDDQWFSFMNS